MADWEDQQLNQRRFAHRSQGRKGGGRQQGRNGDNSVFQPRNMLGRYTVRHLPLIATPTSGEAWLEIHELDETETGFIATFDFGAVSGAMLIAGSRKALRALVQSQADETSTQDPESQEQAEGQVSEVEEDETELADGRDRSQDDGTDSTTASQDDAGLDFARPPELDRPAHAFEKNTFRRPKWFGQWRGQVTAEALRFASANNKIKHMTDDQIQGQAPWHTIDEGNKAHFEFATSNCREFAATFSCPYLGIKNGSVQGWKATNKATAAQLHWNAYHELGDGAAEQLSSVTA